MPEGSLNIGLSPTNFGNNLTGKPVPISNEIVA